MSDSPAPLRGDPTPPVHSIGVRKPMVDGPEKVTGKALYAADFMGALDS